MSVSAALPPYRVLDEPWLVFNGGNRDRHPLRGLVEYGPYSADATGQLLNGQLRVATIGPPGTYRHVGELLAAFRTRLSPQERRDYLPEYPGFTEVLRTVALQPAAKPCHLEIPAELGDFAGEGEPGPRVAAAVSAQMQVLAQQPDAFDVVAVHLPDRWTAAFTGQDDFDLHDAIKAVGAHLSMPTQVLNDDPWTYRCRASVAWRLTIALYTKAGGTPWKLAADPAAEDVAYIGLAYARRGKPSEGRYVTCCSQVFDADGGGMQFVAFDVGEGVDLRNPFLTRDQMRAVMSRSLALYQRRHAGLLPSRVVVHKTSEFKPDEVRGTAEALRSVREIECVQVQTRTDWRAVKLLEPQSTQARNTPDAWPVSRGTMVTLSGRSVLLWTGGNAVDIGARRNFFQGGNSIPGPIVLTRFAGKGPLETTAADALGLTKMDWNNDALFDPVPVTIVYSRRLAQTISHVPTLASHPYPYRLFM
jgi:hypothetical protein